MLENRVLAPRCALLQYRVPPCAHMRPALLRTYTLRRHAMRHATTSGGIKNDAVLVCKSKMRARANASSALRRHAMLHIIHYPTRISSAYRLCRFSASFPVNFVTHSIEVCQRLGTCSAIICAKL